MRLALVTGVTREPSLTHNQTPPDELKYVPAPNADIIIATEDSAERVASALAHDKRPKVLWLQETRFLTGLWHDLPKRDYSLILSNQEEYCKRGARYMTLFGTWITSSGPYPKSKLVSFIASEKNWGSIMGYKTRRSVAKLRLVPDEDCYGGLFGRKIQHKEQALEPYMFSVAIENERYKWWHTEKLFDCFATETVPVYWGCDDFSKLREWGFDSNGIIPFSDAQALMRAYRKFDETLYRSLSESIARNYSRIRELYCAEIALHEVLKDAAILDTHYGLQRGSVAEGST